MFAMLDPALDDFFFYLGGMLDTLWNSLAALLRTSGGSISSSAGALVVQICTQHLQKLVFFWGRYLPERAPPLPITNKALRSTCPWFAHPLTESYAFGISLRQNVTCTYIHILCDACMVLRWYWCDAQDKDKIGSLSWLLTRWKLPVSCWATFCLMWVQ